MTVELHWRFCVIFFFSFREEGIILINNDSVHLESYDQYDIIILSTHNDRFIN